MAYERTWSFFPQAGGVPAVDTRDSVAQYAFRLKEFLKGSSWSNPAPWTVYYSCDGTTVGTAGDGVDRWASAAGIVWATTAGNAHSWMILYKDDATRGRVYMLINCTTPGGTNYPNVQVTFFRNAVSGGTTGSPPSPALPIGGGAGGNTTVTTGGNFVNARYFYGGANAEGDFWFMETLNGAVNRFTLFCGPVGTLALDQHPYYAFHAEAWTSVSPLRGGTYTYNLLGMPEQTNDNSRQACANYAGTTSGWYAFILNPLPRGVLDVCANAVFDFPAYIMVAACPSAFLTNMTAAHHRGRLADFGIAGGTIAAATANVSPTTFGSTIRDVGGTIRYVVCDHLIVPYNAAVS